MRRSPWNVPLHPLVLSLDHGLDSKGTAAALEGGQNVVFLASGASEAAVNVVKRALAVDRGRYVVAVAPSFGFFGGSFERAVDTWRRTLGIDALDLVLALGVGRTSAWSGGVRASLEQLKARGTVKAVGAGLRDRKRLAELLAWQPLDVLVVPYSAARRGAETEVFPFLEARRQAGQPVPTVIAAEATFARALLRAPANYEGRVPTAADCYRYCLASRYVDLVFTAPRNLERASKNLHDFAAAPPLGGHEVEWFAHYGDRVRAQEGGGE